MEYREPKQVAKDEAERIFASTDPDAICETLVGLALTDTDWPWIQQKCLDFTYHSEWSVRAIVATCIGHVARIHQSVDLACVTPRLRELLHDLRTRGYAENAAEDIRTFMGVDVWDSQV